MSFWDDPEIKNPAGEYVKFENAGDSVSGTITGIRRHKWDDGSVCPQIQLTTDDGQEKTMTAGQVQLKTKLADLRPDVGDHLAVKLTQVEKRSGNKTLKHFDVQVKQGAGDKPPF